MLNFLRKLRRNDMNGKYFKYALSEILLVVIGILIALSINNWNEESKKNKVRQDLIENLINEFEDNLLLLEPAIAENQQAQDNMNHFFKHAYEKNTSLSVDSLKALSLSFFQGTSFRMNMAVFEEAKSSGTWSLINNNELNRQMNELAQTLGALENIQLQSINAYFGGPTWEFRKTFGASSKISKGGNNTSSNFIKVVIRDDEYFEIINSNIAVANFENRFILGANLQNQLIQIKESSSHILEILKTLKKN